MHARATLDGADGHPPPATRQGLHLHFAPTTGIAGDMAVAALVDVGVPEGVVLDAVHAVHVPGLNVGFRGDPGITSLVDQFGPPPPLRVVAQGSGIGTKKLHGRPNAMTVALGEIVEANL